jgi:hypothetical protein
MRGRVFLLVVFVVVGVFIVAFNWNAMMQGVRLDLVATEVTTTVGALLGIVAATLVVIFLLAALLDRAGHLSQLSILERHMEEMRHELAQKRAQDMESLAAELGGRFDGMRASLDGAVARLEDRFDRRIEEAHTDLGERLDAVRDRVVVVRDELAADIAEVEDTILRSRPVTMPDEPMRSA